MRNAGPCFLNHVYDCLCSTFHLDSSAAASSLAATEAREERAASIENVRSNLGGKGSKKMMKLLDDQGVKQESKYLLFFADSVFRQWWQVLSRR